MNELILWSNIGLICYVYIGYPFLLILLSRFFSKEVIQAEIYPETTLLIAAYNEKAVIEEKIKNSLLLEYPAEKLEIIVASDGSDDGTDDIVRRYEFMGVKLKRIEPRHGKMTLLNETIPRCKGEIVILSDANTMYQPDAISKLVRNFSDKKVGAVSGDVGLIGKGIFFSESESFYYRYERFIQLKETRLGSIVGVDGAMYAIRKELFRGLPSEIILDDFIISMEIGKRGYRLVYEPDARAIEDTTPDWHDEFRRKVRIVAGAAQSIRMCLGIPHIRQYMFLFEYISHKLLRWWVPFFMIIVMAGNIKLINHGLVYTILAILQMGFYSAAILGLIFQKRWNLKIFTLPFYFCMINAASLVGFIKGLFGKPSVKWKKAKRQVE